MSCSCNEYTCVAPTSTEATHNLKNKEYLSIAVTNTNVQLNCLFKEYNFSTRVHYCKVVILTRVVKKRLLWACCIKLFT